LRRKTAHFSRSLTHRLRKSISPEAVLSPKLSFYMVCLSFARHGRLSQAEPRDGAEFCLWIASQTGYVPVMVDPESIYHWHRLDDRITTSGQPSETQLADIAALGVRYVINLGLHSHEKALPDEAGNCGRPRHDLRAHPS
jgi:hypothetical protein